MTKSALCIIPARSGSKGLIDKNILNFCGKPLMTWPISAALNSKIFDEVIVSTDSEQYQKIALDYGANVPFLRPNELSNDQSSSFEVIEHALSFLNTKKKYFDIVCMLEPTSPLTSSQDIQKAFNLLIANERAKSVVGIGECLSQHPAFLNTINNEGFIEPFNFNNTLTRHIRRQDLPEKFYFFDGSIYLSKVDSLLEKKSFYHEHTLGMEFPKYKNFEIDDKEDFIILNALCKEFLVKER